MSNFTPKRISILAAVLLFVIVLLQNSDPTDLELLFWSIRPPLFFVIIVTLAAGWLLGWFMHVSHHHRKTKSKLEQQATTAAPGEETSPAPKADTESTTES